MSALLTIHCPKCGTTGHVSESFAGHLIHCKHCDEHFSVPSPKPDPPAPLVLGDDIGLAPLSEDDERHARERYDARVLSKNRNELHELDKNGHEIHSPREQWHTK